MGSEFYTFDQSSKCSLRSINSMSTKGMIVITGAAGLIGSAVARELNTRGFSKLLLVDHLGVSNKWMNLRSLRFSRYMEKDDFLSCIEKKLNGGSSEELDEISTIIHLGAQSSTVETDATYLMTNNYRYSIQLARFTEKKKIRMIYASSAATYGDGNLGFKDDNEQILSLRPLNGYGYSKHIFDLWANERNFQPSLAGIKYFNVFGPNEYHKGDMRSLVLKAYEQIQATGRLQLFKSYLPDYAHGEQERDFLYVADAAKMTVHLAIENREATGLFNVGSGRANTWLELAQAIFGAMKKKKRIQFIEMPVTIRSKYQYYTCASIERLQSHGYTENVPSLSETVFDYVTRYLLAGKAHA